jgi:hypothetical protein
MGYEPRADLSPAVGLLPLASGQACFEMAFLALLTKKLYRCDSVVIASFAGTEKARMTVG